mgnify:CR=1 FL=1
MDKQTKKHYRELERQLGYRFRDRALLEAALTHPSFRFESSADIRDNQRLEFLGDAALDLVLAERLFGRLPEADEGVLTSMRSRFPEDGAGRGNVRRP